MGEGFALRTTYGGRAVGLIAGVRGEGGLSVVTCGLLLLGLLVTLELYYLGATFGGDLFTEMRCRGRGVAVKRTGVTTD
jgi:hypothetical protein